MLFGYNQREAKRLFLMLMDFLHEEQTTLMKNTQQIVNYVLAESYKSNLAKAKAETGDK